MDKLKILVVDDESRIRKLVKDFLVRKNFDVIEAENGEQAIDIFFSTKEIALIILDIMMPKLDGWQVCKEIRQYSKVPIIMLTAKSDEKDELQGFDLGVDEYISKPFVRRFLLQEWKRYFEERSRPTRKNWRSEVLFSIGMPIW
jgi:DNA-binding response OmpR family regulator